MPQLLESAIDTKLKLCALWTSIMLCLMYSDYFGLFTPGAFEAMSAFRADPEYRGLIRAAFVMKASPILMIFLSVALPAKYNRNLNIVLGLFFILGLTVLLFVSSRLGSVFNASISLSAVHILEIAVVAFAALVVCYAWKWPRS